MKIAMLIFFCVVYGYAEWELLERAITTGKKIILGHFSKYHLFMFVMFVIVAELFDLQQGWKLVPGMILLEDYSYHWAKGVWIQPGDWIGWGKGGFYVSGSFFPWTYVLLAGFAVIGAHSYRF